MELIDWDDLFERYKSIQKINDDMSINKRGVTTSFRKAKIQDLSEQLLLASRNLERDLDNDLYNKKSSREARNVHLFNNIKVFRDNKLLIE